VAEDVFLFWDLNCPGGLATVAVSLVFRHDAGLVDVVVLLCG
jgi:hypothetical protein